MHQDAPTTGKQHSGRQACLPSAAVLQKGAGGVAAAWHNRTHASIQNSYPYLVLQAHSPEVVCCIEALVQLHVGSLKQPQAQPPRARRTGKLVEPGVCWSCRPVRV